VCAQDFENQENGKVHSPVCSLLSPHIGYATLSQNALGFHDDTVSNGFSSEVISIFCNHRNKKLQAIEPTKQHET